MPMRRFRKRFVRGGRPRTRWLAITPGSRSGLATDTFAYNELAIEDKSGAVPWQRFVGGTLLRVILDVQSQYASATTPANGDHNTYFGHAGLLVTADTTLDATTWDPNKPSGDFMQRLTHGEEQWFWDGYSVHARGGNDAFAFHFDTNVKRRLRENDSLYVAWRHFFAGQVYNGVNYGWTGRVLVQLP